jgi:RPA family protein
MSQENPNPDRSEAQLQSESGEIDYSEGDDGTRNVNSENSTTGQQRSNDNDSNNDEQRRQVAQRVFAREFNDGTYTFKESSEERAPIYSLLPTGERANRVFVVGTLTETEDVGSDSEYWQGRVVDPTGTFFVYAGQYQPEAASILRETEPPEYVAIVGKPRTYETEEGMMNVSLRPESISIVDADTRDRWVVETAMRTIERVEASASVDGDEDSEIATDATEYARMATEQYDRTVEEYKRDAMSALEELDEEATAET